MGIGSHTYKVLTIGDYGKNRLMIRIWFGRCVAISQPLTALINKKAPLTNISLFSFSFLV